ncbi:unnamed protein product [Rhodiola kirilowii]
MVKNRTDSEPVTKTALMDFYSKCGHVDESVMAFGEIGVSDVVACNALLSNFLKNGLDWRVIGVLGKMKKEEGVRFSEFTVCSVLKACALWKGLRQGKQVHGLVMVMGRDMTVLGTVLIKFYCDVGFVDEALNVYMHLGFLGDDVMHNSVVAGCVRGGYKVWALAAILLLALWSMFASTITLKRTAGSLNLSSEEIESVLRNDLDVLEVEEREKVVRHMWDVYTNSKRRSSNINLGLPRFWKEAFEAAYEYLVSDDPGVRNFAVLEIAKMSMMSNDLESSPSTDSQSQVSI